MNKTLSDYKNEFTLLLIKSGYSETESKSITDSVFLHIFRLYNSRDKFFNLLEIVPLHKLVTYFIWSNTDEGFDYWNKVNINLIMASLSDLKTNLGVCTHIS